MEKNSTEKLREQLEKMEEKEINSLLNILKIAIDELDKRQCE